MTPRTNGNPKNATPVKLQLKPPAFPRLPFSSPMGEEILSPTSPKSRTPPQLQYGGKSLAKHPQEREGPKGQGLGLDAIGSDGRQRKKDGSPGRPGLNIVTQFPPRTSSAQKVPPVGNGADFRKGRNPVGLENTKPKVSDQSPSGHVRQASSRSLKSAGSRTRLDALRRGDSKGSNLSPGDRAVVIGISLPPDEVGEHTQSAVTLGSEGGDFKSGRPQLETGKGTSKAPSIIVTPAGSVPPWSAAEEEDKSLTTRPRARSSVYSQAPELMNVIDSSIVPPVPALPPEVRNNNKSGTKVTPERPPRIMSNCTMFDEESDPIMTAHPDLEPSQLRILKYASTDTLNTARPHSQGWWNNIMSPFWPKSPMHLKMPSYPNSPTISFKAQDKTAIMDQEDESPIDEKGGSARSGHTSWTDSPVPEEAEKPALTFDQILSSNDHSRSITALRPNDPKPDYPDASTGLDNIGTAAEYFIACYHDQYEPTPYFECQNHQCLPREFEANGLHEDDLGQPHSRGLGIEEAAGTQAPSREVERGDIMASQIPTNRFSAAFREANTPQRSERVKSEATFIEDLDETPDVHNAHVAPVVKAPEPISMVEPPKVVEEEGTSRRDPPRSRGVERSLPSPPIETIEEEEEPPIRKYRTPPPPPPPPVIATDGPSPKGRPLKRAIPIYPPEPAQQKFEQPRSPPPPTPGVQTQNPGGALPLREMQTDAADAAPPAGNTYIVNHHYHQPRSGEQTSMADFFPPPRFKPYPTQAEADELRKQEMREKARSTKEKKKEELAVKESKPTMLSKMKACVGSRRGAKNGKGGKMTKKKKRLLWLLGAGLVAMILLIVLLAMFLHRRGDNMPVQIQWLNITGYPPIPTGVSTIIQPDAVDEVSGCVDVPNLWSCALPKEQQQSFSSGAPDQPSFRVEIRFENGTNVTSSINNSTSNNNNKRSNGVVNPVTASSFIRHRLLQLRSSLPGSLFSPSPPPPSQEDQTFLGNTTDGIQAPFDGEYTPFFMTFDSPAPLPPSRLVKRTPTSTSTTSSTPSTSANTTDPFPNLTSAIPPAATEPNGTASPATLYPLPSAQPLRLYNRGTPTEHYGFYTYFDKSIFLKSTSALNSSSTTSSIPDDLNGGSSEDAAKLRCTWTQTRFLVQIWTNKPPHLLPSSSNATVPSTTPTTKTTTTATPSSLTNSSANDLSRPGSFPYPITLTLDRHGGDVRSKEIYCYELSNSEEPENGPGDKKLQLEDRGYKGTPVNPASGPFATNKVSLKDGGPGGVDGGSGGCGCVWQNFK